MKPDNETSDDISMRVDALEDKVDTLGDNIKERETSVLRAIKTLLHDLSAVQQGDKKDLKPAIFGLAFAYLRPRVVLIVGSIGAAVFAGVQVWFLIAQTDIIERQSEIMEQQNLLRATTMTPELRILLGGPLRELRRDERSTRISTMNSEISVRRLDRMVWSGPSDSGLELVSRLAEDPKLRDFVLSALRPLLVDESGSVAVAALQILMEQGETEFERIHIRDLDHLSLSMKDISVKSLKISGISDGLVSISNCDIGTLDVEDSVLRRLGIGNSGVGVAEYSFSAFGSLSVSGGRHGLMVIADSFVERVGLHDVNQHTPSTDDPDISTSETDYQSMELDLDTSQIELLNTNELSDVEISLQSSCISRKKSAKGTSEQQECGCSSIREVVADWSNRRGRPPVIDLECE